MGWRGSLKQNCAGREKARGKEKKGKKREQKRLENKEERKIGKGGERRKEKR